MDSNPGAILYIVRNWAVFRTVLEANPFQKSWSL